MRILLSLSLLMASPLTAAPPPVATSLSAAEQTQLRCVALLAIIANDQQRGAPGWQDLPRLENRGRHFAGHVGATIAALPGQSRESVRDAILAEVAAYQHRTADRATLIAEGQACVALMDQLDPPAPPPTMLSCAALATLAARDEDARDSTTAGARNLATLASLFEARAREPLRGEGKSEAESDIILGLERERLAREIAAHPEQADARSDQLEACIDALAEQVNRE